MLYKFIQKRVEKAITAYIDKLPDEKIASIAAKVMGAQGLTESNYKKLIETASGEKIVTIYFGNGDRAVISNRVESSNRGPGW